MNRMRRAAIASVLVFGLIACARAQSDPTAMAVEEIVELPPWLQAEEALPAGAPTETPSPEPTSSEPDAPTPTEPTPQSAQPTETPVAEPTETPAPTPTPAQPSPAPGGGSPGGLPDTPPVEDPSDRQSPATAVDAKDLGQPLSAGGLRIITQRPDRSVYSEITSGRAQVTIRITFDKSGSVSVVDLVKSGGKASIDNPVINAAYEWRAISGDSGDPGGNPGYTLPESGVSLTFVIRL